MFAALVAILPVLPSTVVVSNVILVSAAVMSASAVVTLVANA